MLKKRKKGESEGRTAERTRRQKEEERKEEIREKRRSTPCPYTSCGQPITAVSATRLSLF